MKRDRPAFWDEREPGLARRMAFAPLSLLSGLYATGAVLHRAAWEHGLAKPVRLPCKVVSVGNLVVGGSGKTPIAAWVASALRRRGWPVAIASRGYGGRGAEAVEVVSDGRHVHGRAEVTGDEPMLLAGLAPGVPVLVGRRRDTVGRRAIAAFGAQVLVLDDGFQHHRLARDLDIVCIDGELGLHSFDLLPAGPLREPVSALRDADWLCVVDGDRDDTAAGERDPRLTALADEFGLTLIRGRRCAIELVRLDGSERRPIESLAGQSVGWLSGLARPGSFRRTLEGLGAKLVAERRFPDHHAYSSEDLRDLDPGVDFWLTTEKDAIKILPEWLADRDLWVLRIELEIEDESSIFDALEADLIRKGRLRERALEV